LLLSVGPQVPVVEVGIAVSDFCPHDVDGVLLVEGHTMVGIPGHRFGVLLLGFSLFGASTLPPLRLIVHKVGT